MAGAWGSGNGTTSYSENIGAIGITRVSKAKVTSSRASTRERLPTEQQKMTSKLLFNRRALSGACSVELALGYMLYRIYECLLRCITLWENYGRSGIIAIETNYLLFFLYLFRSEVVGWYRLAGW